MTSALYQAAGAEWVFDIPKNGSGVARFNHLHINFHGAQIIFGEIMENTIAPRCLLLRRPQVESTTGLPRSTIYSLIASGKFPRPVKIAGRTVAWHMPEIEEWIKNLPRTKNIME